METYKIISLGLIFFIVIFLSNPVPYCKTAISQDEKYFFKVTGESMLPSIKDNSYCVCYPKDRYNIGDIVIYFPKINSKYISVAHRITNMIGEDIYVKGDNNNFTETINEDNIYCSIPTVERIKTIF